MSLHQSPYAPTSGFALDLPPPAAVFEAPLQPSDAELHARIVTELRDQAKAAAGLAGLSRKQLREQLERHFGGVDLKERKDDIKAMVERAMTTDPVLVAAVEVQERAAAEAAAAAAASAAQRAHHAAAHAPAPKKPKKAAAPPPEPKKRKSKASAAGGGGSDDGGGGGGGGGGGKKKKKRAAKDREDETPEEAEARRARLQRMNPPMRLSPQLSLVVGGLAELSRPQVVKHLWIYIKQHQLQDPKDGRMILCDENLRAVFDGEQSVSCFKMQKYLSQHMVKKDDDAANGAAAAAAGAEQSPDAV